jgi:hypothetical protein
MNSPAELGPGELEHSPALLQRRNLQSFRHLKLPYLTVDQ